MNEIEEYIHVNNNNYFIISSEYYVQLKESIYY